MNKISIKNKIVAIILSVSMIVSLVPSFSLTFTAETDGESAPEEIICTTCQQTPCVCCEVCKNSPCTCDPAPTDPVQLVNTDETKPCTCTPVDGVHQANCASLCTCEPVDGVHQEGCLLYSETEDEEVVDNCLYCEETVAGDGTVTHVEGCNTLYAVDASAAVGNTFGFNYNYSEAYTYNAKPAEGFDYDEGIGDGSDGDEADFIDIEYDWNDPPIVKVVDWFWEVSGTALWYQVEPLDNETGLAANTWVLVNYTHPILAGDNYLVPVDTSVIGKTVEFNTESPTLYDTIWGNNLDADPSILSQFVITDVYSDGTDVVYYVDAVEGETWPEAYNGYHYVDGSTVREIEDLPESGSGDSTDVTVDKNVVPECDQNCNTTIVGSHNDQCAVKIYYHNLFDNSSAEELYAQWGNLPDDAKDYILNSYSWKDQEKRAALVSSIENGSSGSEDVLNAIELLKSAKTRNEFQDIYNNLSDEIKNKFTPEQLLELETIKGSLESVFDNETEYNGFKVNVKINGDIPADANVKTVPVLGEDLVNVGFTFDDHDYVLTALDITIYDSSGKEWQPTPGKPISITFDVSEFGLEDGAECKVHHKHAGEEPTVSSHIVENGSIVYQTDKLSVMAIAAEYTMYPTAWKSNRNVYWDVTESINNKYQQYSGSAKRVQSVYFNNDKINGKVAKGDSSYQPRLGELDHDWELAGETVRSLGSYYSGTRTGSETDTRKLTIEPAPGYYVKRVIIGCTAEQVDGGATVLGSPYDCGTWKAGKQYDQILNYEKTGEVTIDVPSLAFCHLSNNSPYFTNAYFILIEVAPLPSPLYVEYRYGDISFITDANDKATFDNSANWLTPSEKNGPSGNYEINTRNTRFKYTASGSDDDEKAAQAASWVHFSNTLTPAAVSAAARAGYVFAGWEAIYYTNCKNYSFSSPVGTPVMYSQDSKSEKVNLVSHVRLTAKWEKSQTPLTCSLTISKQVDAPDGGMNSETKYPITIAIDGNLYSGNAKINGTQVSISNGVIELTNGQSCIIENILIGSTYSVYESLDNVKAPEGYEYAIPEYSIGGNTKSTEPPTGGLSGNTSVTVWNKVIKSIPQLGNLLISKDGIQPIDHYTRQDKPECGETQSTIFRVVGNGIDLQVVIVENSSVLIKDLPVGDYTVTENTDWSWRYDPTEDVQSVTVVGGETAETSFENNRNKIYWLSGDSYLKNRWSTTGIKKFNGLNQEITE